MIGKALKLVTASGAIAICAGASAATPTGFSVTDAADAVCVIAITGAMGHASQSGRTEDVRQIAKVQLYFVGKLKGRFPNAKLSEMLTPALQERAIANLAAEIRRCATEIGDVEEDLRQMAQSTR